MLELLTPPHEIGDGDHHFAFGALGLD